MLCNQPCVFYLVPRKLPFSSINVSHADVILTYTSVSLMIYVSVESSCLALAYVGMSSIHIGSSSLKRKRFPFNVCTVHFEWIYCDKFLAYQTCMDLVVFDTAVECYLHAFLTKYSWKISLAFIHNNLHLIFRIESTYHGDQSRHVKSRRNY